MEEAVGRAGSNSLLSFTFPMKMVHQSYLALRMTSSGSSAGAEA